MDPERLEQIIEPLELMLSGKGFKTYGKPIVYGHVKVAFFKRDDGTEVDYSIVVKEDIDNGDYHSETLFQLYARFKKDGEVIPLNPHLNVSSDMPAPTTVANIVRLTIQPTLEKYL